MGDARIAWRVIALLVAGFLVAPWVVAGPVKRPAEGCPAEGRPAEGRPVEGCCCPKDACHCDGHDEEAGLCFKQGSRDPATTLELRLRSVAPEARAPAEEADAAPVGTEHERGPSPPLSDPEVPPPRLSGRLA